MPLLMNAFQFLLLSQIRFVDKVAPRKGGRGNKIFKKDFFAKKSFLKILFPLEVFLFHQPYLSEHYVRKYSLFK
jgi:hypothetical protein